MSPLLGSRVNVNLTAGRRQLIAQLEIGFGAERKAHWSTTQAGGIEKHSGFRLGYDGSISLLSMEAGQVGTTGMSE